MTDDVQFILLKRGDSWIIESSHLKDGEPVFSRYTKLDYPQYGKLVKENYLYIGDEREETGSALFPNAKDIYTSNQILYSDLKSTISELNRINDKKTNSDISLFSYQELKNEQKTIKNQLDNLKSNFENAIINSLKDFSKINFDFNKINESEINLLKEKLDDINGIVYSYLNLKEKIKINQNQINQIKDKNIESTVIKGLYLDLKNNISNIYNTLNNLKEDYDYLSGISDSINRLFEGQKFNNNSIMQLKKQLDYYREDLFLEKVYKDFLNTQISINTNEIKYIKESERIDPNLLIDYFKHFFSENSNNISYLQRLKEQLDDIDINTFTSLLLEHSNRINLNTNEIIKINKNTNKIQISELYKNIKIWNRGFICEEDDDDFIIENYNTTHVKINGGRCFINGEIFLIPTTKYKVESSANDQIRYIFLNPENKKYGVMTWNYSSLPSIIDRPYLNVSNIFKDECNTTNIIKLIDTVSFEAIDDDTYSINEFLLIGALRVPSGITNITNNNIVNYKDKEIHPMFGRCENYYPNMYINYTPTLIPTPEYNNNYKLSYDINSNNSVLGQDENIKLIKYDKFFSIGIEGSGDNYDLNIDIITF
jgi:hypothetical protein